MSVEDLVFSGISPFIDRINRRDPKAWDERKKNIVDYLNNIVLLEGSSIRVKKDEVGWGTGNCSRFWLRYLMRLWGGTWSFLRNVLLIKVLTLLLGRGVRNYILSASVCRDKVLTP